MKRLLPIVLVVLAVVLIVMATMQPSESSAATSPEGAVQSLFAHVKAHDYKGAYSFVANGGDTTEAAFARDLSGRDGSLRTYSALQQADTKVLHESDNEALVRATLEYATAVGAFYDTRDLKVVKEDNAWKVEWPVVKETNVPPQVIQENYLVGRDHPRRQRRLGRAERGSSARAHRVNERDRAGQQHHHRRRDRKRRYRSGIRFRGRNAGRQGRRRARRRNQLRQDFAHAAAERNLALPHRLPERDADESEERAHAA